MIKRASMWDKRFVNLAELIASWSKDPSTKVGAVAVNGKRQILSTGYNGFPRGFDDNPERYADREMKYKYVLHAEQNLISNAVANGVSLTGSIVYVVGMPPCSRCALELIQSDVALILVPERYVKPKLEEGQHNWTEEWAFSVDLFNEGGIDVGVLEKII
jgi:dCMP deaminase